MPLRVELTLRLAIPTKKTLNTKVTSLRCGTMKIPIHLLHGMRSLKDSELIQSMDVTEQFTSQNEKLTDYVKFYQEHHGHSTYFVWCIACNQFYLLSYRRTSVESIFLSMSKKKRPSAISNIVFILSVMYFFGIVPINLFVYFLGGIPLQDVLYIW